MSREKITLQTVSHVAKLARLSFDEGQLQRLAPQLEAILDYVDQLARLDVTDVQPMAHAVPMHNVLRADVPEPGLPIEDVLRNAPQTDERFFKVPKIIGSDDDSAG